MANQDGQSLKNKLADLRREGEERFAKKVAGEAGLPYVDLRKEPVSLEALKLIPEEKAKKASVATIEINVNLVALVVVDPNSSETREIVSDLEKNRYKVKIFVSSLSGLKQAWKFYEFVPEEGEEITGKVGIDEKRFEGFIERWSGLKEFREEMAAINFSQTTTSSLMEMILAGGLTSGASDIHFEAEEEFARVRLRIDGLLHDAVTDFPEEKYGNLISRIKLLSGLKINVRGEPQDGRFTIELTQKSVEVRVSIIPSRFGETVVMRILDPDSINVNLKDLGLRDDDLKIVEIELRRPNGLVLNTGPTGSGKTTTLYSFLRTLVTPEKKIITIEDPIEYQVEGIEQTQVDSGAEYTFSKGLRAIVRQDPDVILVGEIRDKDTAEIAMQAALTGHVVFSTLHTNDAIGAVPRLVELGAKASVIGPAVNLIIAQRLVRKLCLKCRHKVSLSENEKEKIKHFLGNLPSRVDVSKLDNFETYEPGDCDDCNHLGYKGRIGIFEFLEAGPDFERAILKEVSEASLGELVKAQGMVTMQDDGILKVLAGITSFKEIERITGSISW